MRWLPDRTRPQRPILRLFQIAQGAASIGIVLLITGGSPMALMNRTTLCWSLFVVTAWTIFWTRCGWSVTLIIPPIIFSFLFPTCDAPPITDDAIRWAFYGMCIGGWLDFCGLATTKDVGHGDLKSLTGHSPETFARLNETMPDIRGDEK